METKTKTNALSKLAKVGQSPWYDNIERRLIKSGELKKIFENGILGITSNPTIFEKAISSSDEYDQEIKSLSAENKSVLEIYDALTIKDISMAADLLRDTYEKSKHLDGYVSIEVLPEFAHDAEKTIDSARKIFKRIGKPNIMIKVPGTKESAPAVRKLTSEGININVTLLFSTEHYELCANAYINGLKDRAKAGEDIKDVFSVASVFISRVDTTIDDMLAEKGINDLKGAIAVSNAKMIYQSFKDIFGKNEFNKIKYANPQRVLWASTSTKNPKYNDLKYVEELVGPNTINTMPPNTMEAFLDHGKAVHALENDLDRAKSYLEKLKAAGIDINSVCQKIQDAGVMSFQKSFDKLIKSIKDKM